VCFDVHISDLYGSFVQILWINTLKKDICFGASDFKLVGYNPHEGIEMEIYSGNLSAYAIYK
jgi:hypothetical protein